MVSSIRPLTAMGIALTSASMIAAGPVVLPEPPAHFAAAEIALTSLGWQDIGFYTPNGPVIFDSTAEAQAYAVEMTATTLSYGQTAVEWAGWLEPVLSFAGISGIADWVSDRYDMVAEILSPGWEPVPWLWGYYETISNDPEWLFRPMADFDLGWLWGLLGISGEDGTQLDGLLELASGYVGGMLIWQLLEVYALTPGAINAVVAGLTTIDDLYVDVGSPMDLLINGARESVENWMMSAEDEFSSVIGSIFPGFDLF